MEQRLCPVCGMHYFSEKDSYEICPVCGWEDDWLQRADPEYAGGANKISLNEAIEQYKKQVK
ncbi:MAG: hypothetical protein MJ144_03810 [Clostridia bacterium]|nr:hypothetical protein [Clostridia bacterium]